ncbi:hypothetical protein MPTK1_4g02170 [Marchantia polymorpha subsp. ruderalis]|uniref:Uncharacterized protein n=2 Tax=Marchantia polymorpha TaxID=3197 RepID=A0AAF6B5F5_MARPO|nr:hypothetical protein MARPO_0080s0082 [Marchantia polymorpha]BBN07239.1 hypothetical protein Mp_4g02170 [Marchantia polymorpha subsp. ruderalis]|eukprot:PTQ34467.1 hypothetical protein MARPO_0080s0082 [Marchantia polymorpha]
MYVWQVKGKIFTDRALVPELERTKKIDVIRQERASVDVPVDQTEVTVGTSRQLRVTQLATAPPPPRKAPTGRTPWVVIPPSPPSGTRRGPISPAPAP